MVPYLGPDFSAWMAALPELSRHRLETIWRTLVESRELLDQPNRLHLCRQRLIEAARAMGFRGEP